MTLNVNQPTDQVIASELPQYIREGREEINSVSTVVTGDVGKTVLALPARAVILSVGTDVGAYDREIILVTGASGSSIVAIYYGTAGQVKTFVFLDSFVDMTDGLKSNGQLYLNHLPALSNYSPQEGAVLSLVNIGGNGSSNHGYWKELYRNNPVK